MPIGRLSRLTRSPLVAVLRAGWICLCSLSARQLTCLFMRSPLFQRAEQRGAAGCTLDSSDLLVVAAADVVSEPSLLERGGNEK